MWWTDLKNFRTELSDLHNYVQMDKKIQECKNNENYASIIKISTCMKLGNSTVTHVTFGETLSNSLVSNYLIVGVSIKSLGIQKEHTC